MELSKKRGRTILKAIMAPIFIVFITISIVNTAIAGDAIDLATAGMGARSIGMGSAYTAVADDTAAILANPAGLGFQKQWGVTSMNVKLMKKIDYKVTGVVYPLEFGTIGVGYLSASSVQSASYGSNMLMLSWGKDLNMNGEAGKLSVGANVSATSSGTGMDLGFLYKPTENISGGISLRNAIGSVDWNSVNQAKPKTLTVGAAINNGIGLITMDVDLSDNNTLLRGGAEYRPLDRLIVRAGIDQTAVIHNFMAYNFSGGVGISLDGFSFDYAYKQAQNLVDNATHYFSISYQPAIETKKEVVQLPAEKLGLFSKNSENEEQIFEEVLNSAQVKAADTFSSRIENTNIILEILVN